MGQLVTIQVQVAKADVKVNVQQGALNACGFSVNHVVVGTMEAGIDLTQVEESDIVFDGSTDTYTLTLPSAQLTGCRVDYIRQYDTSTTACSIDWDEARLLAQYVSLQELRDDTLEAGILNRAHSG